MGTRPWLLALATLCAGGCDSPAPPPSEPPAAQAAVPKYSYVGKSPIRARMTLLATGEGGRVSPLHGGYRPTVAFDAAAGPTPCSVSSVDGGFDPGETHDVTLRCARAVTVRPDALGFTVREGEQVVGSGVVLP